MNTVFKGKKHNGLAITLKILAGFVALCLFTFAVMYGLIVYAPVKSVDNTYAKQTKMIKEMAERTEPIKVLKTNAELQTLTDDEAFILFASISGEATDLADYDNSFEKFANLYIADFDSDIKYEQLITFSDYIRSYCGTSDLTEVNLTGATQDYLCNMIAVCLFDKATLAIDTYYTDNYSDYIKSESHFDITSPLQLTELVTSMVSDTELYNKLWGNCVSIGRICDAEYQKLKDYYKLTFGNTSTIQSAFFDMDATSVADLVTLRMLACKNFEVGGSYIPMNLSNEDVTAINEYRKACREKLIKANIRFNMTSDGETVTGFEKFAQKFASFYLGSVYDKLADYNNMELNNFIFAPFEFDDTHKSKYTRDYVFWNVMLNVMDIENAHSAGVLTISTNYKTATYDYAYIIGGNNFVIDDELSSLLWTTGEQQLMAQIYAGCKLDIDEDGNIVAEDTNDELTASYRNWLEAMNLWGSQFVQ